MPGRDAASQDPLYGAPVEGQDTLYGAPVEVAEYPGVHVEPPQPAEEEEPLSSFFGDCGGVKSPCQVLSDVDPEEPEAADSLHRSAIDGDGGVSLSLLLPVIYNQPLGFADVEMEVVILAPR